MFFFRRKKKDENEKSETDKTIEELQKKIDTQDAKIITFKEDIAPQMAETIKSLRMELNNQYNKLKQKDEEIEQLNLAIKEMSSGSSEIQKEEFSDLIEKYKNEAKIYKEKVSEQADKILDLQKKIALLPEICSRLMEEITKRNARIQFLTQKLEKFKDENAKLSIDLIELETRLEEQLKIMEDKEFKMREVLKSIDV